MRLVTGEKSTKVLVNYQEKLRHLTNSRSTTEIQHQGQLLSWQVSSRVHAQVLILPKITITITINNYNNGTAEDWSMDPNTHFWTFKQCCWHHLLLLFRPYLLLVLDGPLLDWELDMRTDSKLPVSLLVGSLSCPKWGAEILGAQAKLNKWSIAEPNLYEYATLNEWSFTPIYAYLLIVDAHIAHQRLHPIFDTLVDHPHWCSHFLGLNGPLMMVFSPWLLLLFMMEIRNWWWHVVVDGFLIDWPSSFVPLRCYWVAELIGGWWCSWCCRSFSVLYFLESQLFSLYSFM